MKRLLLFALFLPALYAQQQTPQSTQQPDCRVYFYMTGASSGAQAPTTPVNGANGVSLVIDNRQAACDTWVVSYSSFGFSAVTLRFQSAPNGSAAVPTAPGVPGTWADFGGTITSGVNPMTSTTQTEVKADGYFPFVRVNLTAKTGSGIIIGELHGVKTMASTTVNATISGTVSVQGTKSNNAVPPGANNLGVLPCLANAAAPTWTEGNQVVCSEDLTGNLRITGPVTQTATSTALADGASNTEPLPTASGAAVNQRNFAMKFNGATWDRDFSCALQTTVALTDSTRTQLVALVASQIIRVCHFHFTTTAPEDITISYGTGSACGTGTTTIDKFLSSQFVAMDYSPFAALRTIASNALCVTQSGTQNAQVTVIYDIF